MLIGISGKHDGGKGTVSRIIQALDIYPLYTWSISEEEFVKDYVWNWKNVSKFEKDTVWDIKYFAYNVKKVVSIMTGCSVDYLMTHKGKDSKSKIINPLTEQPYYYRELLQLVGTNIGRTISPSIWIDSLFADYDRDKHWIIEDVRFPNELEAIKSRGGFIIRCERDGLPYDNHPSETSLDGYTDKFDCTIQFSYNLKRMINPVKEFIESHNLYVK